MEARAFSHAKTAEFSLVEAICADAAVADDFSGELQEQMRLDDHLFARSRLVVGRSIRRFAAFVAQLAAQGGGHDLDGARDGGLSRGRKPNGAQVASAARHTGGAVNGQSQGGKACH